MLRITAVGMVLVFGTLGLAGSASALCQYNPSAFYANVCLLEELEPQTCCGGVTISSYVIASAGIHPSPAYGYMSAEQTSYDYATHDDYATGLCLGGGAIPAPDVTACGGQYAYDYDDGFSGTTTHATTWTPAGYVSARQNAFTTGCYFSLVSPLGYSVIACGPVPGIPRLPVLPHL